MRLDAAAAWGRLRIKNLVSSFTPTQMGNAASPKMEQSPLD
jgi:hypothetical protein